MVKQILKSIIPAKIWKYCRAYLKNDWSYNVIPVCDWPRRVILKEVMDCYEMHMGYRFDLQNPKLFTEKIQWYKTFYNMKGVPFITDKVTFKSYIKKQLGEGYTIPLYGHWYSIKELMKDWSSLPKEFVLKSNLSSDGKCIKIIHDKSRVNIDELCNELSSWLNPLNTCLNTVDYRIYNSKPQILAEEYFSNFEDQLYDYKFFCFDGIPFCVYVAQDHFGMQGYLMSFYNLEWKKLDVKYGEHPIGDAPKPPHFEEMKVIAAKLSKDFSFVRVDFFDTEDKLFCAEMTFDPGGGYTPYYPESFNRELGDMFILPTNKSLLCQ